MVPMLVLVLGRLLLPEEEKKFLFFRRNHFFCRRLAPDYDNDNRGHPRDHGCLQVECRFILSDKPSSFVPRFYEYIFRPDLPAER